MKSSGGYFQNRASNFQVGPALEKTNQLSREGNETKKTEQAARGKAKQQKIQGVEGRKGMTMKLRYYVKKETGTTGPRNIQECSFSLVRLERCYPACHLCLTLVCY